MRHYGEGGPSETSSCSAMPCYVLVSLSFTTAWRVVKVVNRLCHKQKLDPSKINVIDSFNIFLDHCSIAS